MAAALTGFATAVLIVFIALPPFRHLRQDYACRLLGNSCAPGRSGCPARELGHQRGGARVHVALGTPVSYLLGTKRSWPAHHHHLFRVAAGVAARRGGHRFVRRFWALRYPGSQLGALGIQLPFTWAVVMAQAFVAMPFFVRQATAGFAAVDPHLLGVSRTLGAGSARTFFRVAAPLAGPSLSAGAALAWARALGEFGATTLFAGSLQGTTQTLPLAIYGEFSAANMEAALAMGALMVALSGAILAAVKMLRRTTYWK